MKTNLRPVDKILDEQGKKGDENIIARSCKRRSNLCRRQRLLRSARNDTLCHAVGFCPVVLSLCFLLLPLLFIGCGAKELRTNEFQVAADTPNPAKPPDEFYTIGPGDELEIAVWKEESLSGSVTVRPDGYVTLPLVNEIQVVGLTPTQLRSSLEEKYQEFVTSPTVMVRVVKIASNEIFLVGEVNSPGAYPVAGNDTVLQLLTRAGGLTIFADRDSIRIVRRAGEKVTEYTVDYDAIVEGDLKQDILLRPGDRIIVP